MAVNLKNVFLCLMVTSFKNKYPHTYPQVIHNQKNH